ncbi:hypothetical protein M5689_008629 [Euphorbia peplus]|nr:hypothetical protein M5689_008629 [Euphorbia peplus]
MDGADDLDFVFICHFGGDLRTDNDGSLDYQGGSTHAINISLQSLIEFSDLYKEVDEAFKFDYECYDRFEFKYLLPGTRKTLVTVSNSKDLNAMKKLLAGLVSVHLYVIPSID